MAFMCFLVWVKMEGIAIAPNPNTNEPVITWEKPPDGYPIPDDPVDNINQPPIAAALTDSLNQSGHLTPEALATTDYGLRAQGIDPDATI
jgi:hypothetical protein